MKQRIIAATALLLFFAGIIAACFILYNMAYPPQAAAAEIVKIDKPYPVIEVRYLEVPGPVIWGTETITEIETVEKIVEVQKKYAPVSFESEAALREWVGNWPRHAVSFGTIKLDSMCENYSFAMLIDMVNDGYIAGTQIEPIEGHMLVVVPIYPENRFLFVEPQNGEITDTFMGSRWRID